MTLPVAQGASAPAEMSHILGRPFELGQAPDKIFLLAHDLGWGVEQAEFFVEAANRSWANLFDHDQAKALLLFVN